MDEDGDKNVLDSEDEGELGELFAEELSSEPKSTKDVNSSKEDSLLLNENLTKPTEISECPSSTLSECAESYVYPPTGFKRSKGFSYNYDRSTLGETEFHYQPEEGEVEYICQSEFETPQVETKAEKESVYSSETLSSVYTKLSPFTAKWSFGVKKNVELINLTTTDNFEIFYVSSHFGVIYNYCTNQMTFLPGHNYPISSIASDDTGRWLVSADSGEDSVIIIWDNKNRVPVWSLYNVFPNEGVRWVKISQDAKYLAAVNCNFNYSLKFWLWTYGREEADGEVSLDSNFGKAKHIDFNHIHTEQLAITMDSKVIFCEWIMDTKTLEYFVPEIEKTKKLGMFRESLFLDDNHRVLTSTSTGYITVWCDIKYSQPILETIPGTIRKNYLKSVRIHKTGITSLRLCDNIIASSSEEGIIFFHDQELRLMYFVPKFKLDPLVSISFHKSQFSDSQIDPFSSEFTEMSRQINEEDTRNNLDYEASITFLSDKNLLDDHVNEFVERAASKAFLEPISKKVTKPVPSDCTFDTRSFISRDFIFLTTTGRVGYVSHRRKKIKYYLYNTDSPALCVDCNPNKEHVLVGSASGRLSLYEYLNKKLLVTAKLNVVITTLKYSNLGHILMAGTRSGVVLELDSQLLIELRKLEMANSQIVKICFSPHDDIIAYFDESSIVYVYQARVRMERQWVFMGKYKSHYKPIVDIIFEEQADYQRNPRLFSIGEDRMLVEYDTKNLEEGKLKLISICRIEQTAIPRCFTWHPKFQNTTEFLINNNEYKLKVVDMDSRVCKKTTLGPTADTPINFMKVIPEKDINTSNVKMFYTTNKHIGIRNLPSTGNPFEGMGMVGHPEKLVSVTMSFDYNYIFTAGANDPCVLMWEMNPSAVDVATQLGGNGLEPFVCLIEGGSNSFLFREIEDFFYYAQIIHQGEDPNLDRSVAKTLALCEIPDMYRSLGYYPTEYEINNLIYELKHLDYEKTGELTEEISFEECVKAFLNHRPVHGVSLDHINKALLAIADLTDPTDIIVEREELYKALEEKAEGMEHAEAMGYLCILLLPKDENNPAPPSLSLSEFAENVLGIDLTISEENVREITHAFEMEKT